MEPLVEVVPAEQMVVLTAELTVLATAVTEAVAEVQTPEMETVVEVEGAAELVITGQVTTGLAVALTAQEDLERAPAQEIKAAPVEDPLGVAAMGALTQAMELIAEMGLAAQAVREQVQEAAQEIKADLVEVATAGALTQETEPVVEVVPAAQMVGLMAELTVLAMDPVAETTEQMAEAKPAAAELVIMDLVEELAAVLTDQVEQVQEADQEIKADLAEVPVVTAAMAGVLTQETEPLVKMAPVAETAEQMAEAEPAETELVITDPVEELAGALTAQEGQVQETVRDQAQETIQVGLEQAPTQEVKAALTEVQVAPAGTAGVLTQETDPPVEMTETEPAAAKLVIADLAGALAQVTEPLVEAALVEQVAEQQMVALVDPMPTGQVVEMALALVMAPPLMEAVELMILAGAVELAEKTGLEDLMKQQVMDLIAIRPMQQIKPPTKKQWIKL